MNYFPSKLRILVGLALISLGLSWSALPASGAAAAVKPTIDFVRGRVVRVRVPAGLESVTLERCTSLRQDKWQIVATKSTDRVAGTVSFDLTAAVSRRFLRVSGIVASATEIAGSHLFLADPALGSGGGGAMLFDAAASVSNSAVSLAPRASAAVADGASTRSVSESDIWRVAGDRLYFFNELRGLQIFDIANPDDPALLGQLRASGSGEEMYLLNASHVVLLTRGSNILRLSVASDIRGFGSDTSAGSVVVADVSKNQPTVTATLDYRGWLRESRLVGAVLYVVSETWDYSDEPGSQQGLVVTSFDLSDPAHPAKRDTLFLGNSGGVITATDKFLFVARHADDWLRSTVEIVDISSPTGALVKRGSIETAGVVNDKFKMHLDGNVFTVVSAIPRVWRDGQWQWRDGTWSSSIAPADNSRTMVETFSLTDPQAPAKLGSLELGVGESVRATRFDDKRLYVVTFFQIDPLWVVDLTQPTKPKLLGELEVPGFSNYILPLGDRLVAVGHVGSQTAVSLFDVSDPAHPAALSQVPLGAGYSYSEANWTEKAFNVMPEENLIVVPYSGYDESTGYASRVQLIDLNRNALVKRGVIEGGFAARRTAVKDNRLLAISATDLVTVNFADRDKPVVTSDVEIAWRVDRVFLAGDYLVQLGGAATSNSDRQQTLVVSTASAPDSILTTVQLDAAPVVGAAMKNGQLYIAQYRAASYSSNDIVGREVTAGTVAQDAAFTLSVYDLTSLPAIPRLATTTSKTDLGYTNELTAAWPSPGVLVWVRQQSRFWWGWGGDRGRIFLDTPLRGAVTPPLSLAASPSFNLAGFSSNDAATSAAVTTTGTSSPTITRNPAARVPARAAQETATRSATAPPAVSSLSIAWSARPWWNYSDTGVEALVFDVSEATAPKLASKLDIRTGSTGEWSEAFAAAGKLYVSSVAFEDFVTIGEKPEPSSNTPSRRNRHFMKVVDLADPTKPVIRADVNVPGKLIGISNNGARLYTAGCKYDAGVKPSTDRALHASNYDGTAATLVDQIPLTSYDNQYTLDGDTILIGLRASDTKPSRIEAWQLDTVGKFQRSSENPLDNIGTLDVVRGLLVVGQSGGRHLFDVTDAANFRDLGDLPNLTPYYWHGDLKKADGTPNRGLWNPFGNYGVEFVTFPR